MPSRVTRAYQNQKIIEYIDKIKYSKKSKEKLLDIFGVSLSRCQKEPQDIIDCNKYLEFIINESGWTEFD